MSLKLDHKLRFEPFVIHQMVDETGHYNLKLDPEFPFFIKLFSYETLDPAVRLNWHNRLELFVPVTGEGLFRMGDREIAFRGGDVLVVDNLKLHGLVSFQGRRRDAIVISFRAELFYNLGAPLCDFTYLTPFFSQADGIPPILRAGDPLAAAVHDALRKLLDCYFNSTGEPHYRAGCKAYLSEILYLLTRHSGWTDLAGAEYARRREQGRRLGALVDYLDHNYAEKIAVAAAAAMIGMSESRFMKFFKQATGMTFVNYLTHLRVTKARQLLRDPNLSIAQVAAMAGFADQSYFDKKFRERFGKVPRDCRSES